MCKNVVLCCIASLFLVPDLGRADEPLVLFNGKNLDGWTVEGTKDIKGKDDKVAPIWSVQDGLLRCEGKGFGFLRYDKKEFADFVFHVEYRMTPKCNSGIGIRTIPFDPKKNPATRPS